jgi:hypothetical protein
MKFYVHGTATAEVPIEASSRAEAKAIAMNMHSSGALRWSWHECDVDVLESEPFHYADEDDT